MSITYIGRQISLISTSDVRYEGTLHAIDADESTIALKNVTHLGTENRRTDKVIEASPTVFEYIIFRGENIKNLKMIQGASEAAENVITNDPAVVEVKQGPKILKPTAVESPEQQQWNSEGDNFRMENWNRGRGIGNLPIRNSGTNNFRRGHSTSDCWNNGQNAGGRGVGYSQGNDNNNYQYSHYDWTDRSQGRGRNANGNVRYGWNNGQIARGRTVSYNQGNYNNNYQYPHKDWTSRTQGRGRNAYGNVRRRGGRGGRSSRNEERNSQNFIPGTGKFLEQNTRENDDSELVVPNQEYDFQGNLARFDMSSLRDALSEEAKEAPEKEPKEPKDESSEDDENETKEEVAEEDLPDEISKDSVMLQMGEAYDADNFFDNLSTDNDTYVRQSGADMRELNAETFGSIGSTYMCQARWFRRWNGGGSRTLFRGAHTQRK